MMEGQSTSSMLIDAISDKFEELKHLETGSDKQKEVLKAHN